MDEHKGYIRTSNGIWLYDIDNQTIGEQLEGTGSNPGDLYMGQTGTMLRVGDRVFAVNQQNGLLVIDANTHTLQTTVKAPQDGANQRGYGSIVQSKDGNLWLSVASDISGAGNAEDYIIKLNPWTLDTTRITLPAGYAVPNSWYAWTADGFCSSKQENKLYWKDDAGWFSSTRIYAYDIESGQTEIVYDLADYDDGKWGFYGTAFRIDPVSNAIYAFLFRAFSSKKYQTIRINPATKEVVSYPMDDHHWFPALPVFPDNAAPVVSAGLTDISLTKATRIYLGDKVSDADNLDAAIVKSILTGYNTGLINAIVRNDSLVITPVRKTQVSGNTTLRLKFNSNGRVVTKDITVTVESTAIPVTGLTLSHETAELTIGETLQLTATVLPENAGYQSVSWISSIPSVASVDENGLITAQSPGTTVITATLPNGMDADCHVTVRENVATVEVIDISDNSATLSFPILSEASYYLIRLFEISGSQRIPVAEIKVNPDGSIANISGLRAAGDNIHLEINGLKPRTLYEADIDVVRMINGTMETVSTLYVTFTTTGISTGIESSAGQPAKVWYADGSIRMLNLEAYTAVLINTQGQLVARFRINSPEEVLQQQISTGIYFLMAEKDGNRKTFRFIVH
ncbi:MAG: DUF5074 domain-containing protein [Tannerellaceae bacterium]|nr:DUF5074 domain-containing protein [Tannerellaceae bacterium]